MKSEKQWQARNEHKLKVYSFTTGSMYSFKEVPQIRIQGKWLSEAGFEPGTRTKKQTIAIIWNSIRTVDIPENARKTA